MFTITNIVKHKQDIKVTFNHEIDVSVLYDVFVKYHMNLNETMDKKTFLEMQKENAFLFFKRLALKKLSRMMTAYEVYTYLIEKGAPVDIVKQLVFEFKEKKYIDDDAYAKQYVTIKKYQEGPRLMIDKLTKKGIAMDHIMKHVNDIDEIDCLTLSIDKKMKHPNQMNKKQWMMKLKRYYLQKGFSYDAVSEVVHDIVMHMHVNEKDLLTKEVYKLMKKHPDDKTKIIEKLYRKGFKYDDIKALIEENFK